MDRPAPTQARDSGAAVRVLSQGLAFAALLGTTILVGLMLWASRRGLDFTDEGFYLASIAGPGVYQTSVSQFGFVYHPFFELLGSDIVRARQANILLTFGGAFLLAHVVTRRLSVSRLQRTAMSAAFASASLMIFVTWLITPSYNSLALQAMMLTMAGVVLVSDQAEPVTVGWWLIGVGGALAFLAKPTTALALAVVVLLCLVSTRSVRVRWALGAGLTSGAVLLASALLIDGSISTFVNRISDDADLIAELDGGHSFGEALRIDRLDPGLRLSAVAVIVVACVGVATYVLQTTSRVKAMIGAIAVIVGCVAGALVIRGHLSALFESGPQRALLMISVPLAAAIICLGSDRLGGIRNVSLRRWVLFVAFLILPNVYAFGSNGDYWNVGGAAAVFWIVAGLVLLAPTWELRVLPTVILMLGIVTQILTAAFLVGGAQSPYRQPVAVRDQDVAVRVTGSTVMVGAAFAQYLRDATTATADAGFRRGTPIIDMTGKSPTLLYALGAKSIGQAWIIGGYPGSARVALEALTLAGCRDVSSAWILTEPAGPRRIPETVLAGLGIDLETDHRVAGAWDTAPGVAGFADPVRQVLWKPTRPAGEALDACGIALASDS